jgi:predicted GIY-YIG superfamily endonuclease
MPIIKNAIIYLLFSESANLKYYGSTRQRLSQRLAEHRRDCKKNNCVYSKEIINCPDYKIIALEEFQNISSTDLKLREGFYIKNNECTNKYVAGATLNENYKRDYMREYKKRSRGAHPH